LNGFIEKFQSPGTGKRYISEFMNGERLHEVCGILSLGNYLASFSVGVTLPVKT